MGGARTFTAILWHIYRLPPVSLARSFAGRGGLDLRQRKRARNAALLPSWRIARASQRRALQNCRHYRLHFPFRRGRCGGPTNIRLNGEGGENRENRKRNEDGGTKSIWFFLCASVVGLPFADGRSSERAKTTAPYGDGAAGRSGEGGRGQEGIQNRKSRLKASAGGGRARPRRMPIPRRRKPQGKKKTQREGRLQPILPPSLAASAVGRLRPFLSFVRSPRSSAMVPFTQKAGLDVAQALLAQIYR